MLVKINATSIQQLKSWVKEWQDIEEIVNLIYINLNNRNHQKHHANSMKLFEESGVENCKIVLIEEYPCQNRKQLEKRDGEYIGNDKSRLNRCIAGRTRTEYYDATGEHHLDQKKQHRIFK